MVGATLVEGAAVVLATGHSARDIYELLHRRGVRLEAKAFAMGVRIEASAGADRLNPVSLRNPRRIPPAAAYSLVSQENGRGVYSFCMCPGGFIVPAMTDAAQSVVNGMSPSGRTSPYANSGLVTEVRLADFEHLRPNGASWRGCSSSSSSRSWRGGTAGNTRSLRRSGSPISWRACERIACQDFLYSGDRPFAARPVDARLHRAGIAAGAHDLRPPDAGLFDRRGAGRGRGVADLDSPVRVPRDPGTLMHPETEGCSPRVKGPGMPAASSPRRSTANESPKR